MIDGSVPKLKLFSKLIKKIEHNKLYHLLSMIILLLITIKGKVSIVLKNINNLI